jgi:hypothetical protein
MNSTTSPLIEKDTSPSAMNKQDKDRVLYLVKLHMVAIDDSDNALFCFKAIKNKCVNQFDTHNPSWADKLLLNIENGFEVFLTVNLTDGTGTKTVNVTGVRALYLDFDDTSQDNLAIIETMPLAPNLVVNSSKGKFHCYWRVDDCPLDQFTKLQKALAAKYNGDPSVSDLPRIMRLAGSYNLKSEPHQVTVISHQDDVYTTDEIITEFSFGSFGSEELGVIDKKNNEVISVGRKEGIVGHTKNIAIGINLHDSLLSLAGYLANDNMCADSIVTYLQSLMNISSATKDNRYFERYNDIYRIVNYVINCKQVNAANTYWPAPKPLVNELKPVKQLNIDLLPKVMQSLVVDSAERMQCPPDFLAAGLLIVASSIIARNVVVQPKHSDTGWVEVPNLWGVIIGKPSLLKTPTLSIAMAALDKLEIISRELHKEELKEFQVDCELMEIHAVINKKEAKSAITKDKNHSKAKAILMADQIDDDEPPSQTRYIINDGTFEKIADLQCSNTKGLLVFRDELSGWLKGLNKPDKTNDRSFYLESWNGNKSYTVDRIGRGTTFIPTNRLSILGGIQPDVFSNLILETVSGSQGGDGLLQRFQVAVYPDLIDKPAFIDKAPNKQAFVLFRDKIISLAKWSNDHEEQHVLQFDKEAYHLYKEWYLHNETLIRADNQQVSLEAHYAKYRGLVPSIAAIFHVLEVDSVDESPLINKEDTLAAIEYVEYLRTHAERIYSLPEQYVLIGAKVILKNFDKLNDTFLVRDVYRKKWKGLTTKDLVEPSLAILEESGYCMPLETDPKSIGRSTTYYVKHPDYQLPKLTEVSTIQQNKKLSEVNHA